MLRSKKQNVSVRLQISDLQNMKEIAALLRVRESDVMRFSVRSTLKRLLPLKDSSIRGRQLLPVLLNIGAELVDFFDLEECQLYELVNMDVPETQKVAMEDIELVTMCTNKEQLVLSKLKDLLNQSTQPFGVSTLVKQYLCDKYAFSELIGTHEFKR